ncbi:hypothetical protein LIA77_02938 [Sarocladium implicatum]|nr:hypothetical protein LIA77_02938 [Sarocladium implicatum]
MASQETRKPRVRAHQLLRISLPPLDGARSDNLFMAPSTRGLNKVVGIDERFLIEPPVGFGFSNRLSCDENGPPPSPDWGRTVENKRHGEEFSIVPLVLQLSLEQFERQNAGASRTELLTLNQQQTEQQKGKFEGDAATSPSSSSSSSSSSEGKYIGSWFEHDDDDGDDEELERKLHRSTSLRKLEGDIVPNDIKLKRENTLARLDGEVRSRNRDYSEYPDDLRSVFEGFRQKEKEAADQCRHLEIMTREVLADKRETRANASDADVYVANEARAPHGGQLLRSQLIKYSPISEGWRFLAWDEEKQALLLHLKHVRTVPKDGSGPIRRVLVSKVRNLNACSKKEYLEAMREAAEADWRVMIWVADKDEEFPMGVPWPSPKATITKLSVR